MLIPPEKPDGKKSVVQSQDQHGVVESGRDFPEGDPKADPIKYYKVRCPRCGAQPGFPCFTDLKHRAVDYRTICISRLILYEAFELGAVDVNGISRNSPTFKGKSWGQE
jgi:hypothetical protein